MIDVERLSHVLYAFVNLREDGVVTLLDPYGDVERKISSDGGLQGNFGELYSLKMRYRHLKVIMSVGGGSHSSNFATVASDIRKRENFAQSVTKMIQDLGLDGVDVDWEHPSNLQQGRDFLSLLQTVRTELDRLSRSKNTTPYLLSAALSCGKWAYQNYPLREMGSVLDHFYLMAYDYSGTWTKRALHQACLFASDNESACTDTAVRDFIAAGIPSQKIILGIPLYGRGFGGTNGFGCPYENVSGENEGTWKYKNLPVNESHNEFIDHRLCATGSYSSKESVWVSYDTPEAIQLKADYVRKNRLGGMFFWELDGDFRKDHVQYDKKSLIVASNRFLGIEAKQASLDMSLNHTY